jgi:hypothetical protein
VTEHCSVTRNITKKKSPGVCPGLSFIVLTNESGYSTVKDEVIPNTICSANSLTGEGTKQRVK